MALTKKDIEKLSEVFLTKAEAKNFATKDDLRNFATKDDLRNFATKDDLRQLRDEVLANGDKIIKIVEDIRIEQRMAYAQDKRQDEKLDNHETRIGSLEARVPA